jgi:Tfp pilus assembly protein PilO
MKNATAILLILISVGLFYVFIDPTYAEIQKQLVEKGAYDEALNNSEKVMGIRDELLNKYNGFLPTDVSRLMKLLPDQINNIRLIIEVDNVAARHNMAIRDVQLAMNSASTDLNDQTLEIIDEPYGTGNITFKVSGTYDEYLSFIRDLEKSLRIIDITDIGFKSSGGGNPSQLVELYEYEMTFNTYWFKQ